MGPPPTFPTTHKQRECCVCGDARSLPKNDIIFCDGKDCDIAGGWEWEWGGGGSWDRGWLSLAHGPHRPLIRFSSCPTPRATVHMKCYGIKELPDANQGRARTGRGVEPTPVGRPPSPSLIAICPPPSLPRTPIHPTPHHPRNGRLVLPAVQ